VLDPVSISMNKTIISLVALVVLAASLGYSHAGTEDAICKLVFDATAKGLTTPNHSYMKLHLPNVNGGKPADSETINTGKARYMRGADGKWAPSMSPQDNLDQMADNRKENQYACRFIRNETIDGVAASLYEIRGDTGLITKTWLSKSNGLPVHVINDAGSMHSEQRFVYGPVSVPQLN
jgi:hypothetical protein